jgi:diguanylate cyclase (GGDEF)-like protein
VNSSPIAEPDGRQYGALGTYVDVTGRVERERRTRHEADTDELTGLANRRSLGRTLAAALTRAEARRAGVGLLMIDLDGFKAVNDRLGHAAGDSALREVAARLRGTVRERDLVARAGGDEFVVVLPDITPGDGATGDCAERISAAFATPFDLGGGPVEVRAAAGIACFPQDAADAEGLIAAADRARYARKTGDP